MKYSRKKLIQANRKNKFLFFWGHRPNRDGHITKSCFSQWWEREFTVDGVVYSSAEHWMMAEKAELFDDPDTKQLILQAKTPGEAKKLGRKVKNFNPEKWDSEKYSIVMNGNLHKFQQDLDLKEYLLSTNSRVLVEASPVDPIWGIGLAADNEAALHPIRWKGQNLLGFALMEVRDILKNEKE